MHLLAVGLFPACNLVQRSGQDNDGNKCQGVRSGDSIRLAILPISVIAVGHVKRHEHHSCDDTEVIGVIGDYNERNPTHAATNNALEAIDGLRFGWVATDELRQRWAEIERLRGILVAPASPYRDMEAALDVIRLARERGVPLVGT